jgi:superfamily II DNA or RNA helicase/DNA-directed RNA polymerase subunit RPC12/RpoP
MIELHEYQKEAVLSLNRRFQEHGRALLVAPAGIGKTIKAAAWAKQHIGSGRGLFLCHENRILEQAQAEFRQVLGNEASLGVFHGEQKVFDEVDVCFASFQTFRHWKDAFFPDEFLYVIVDEGHHAGAPTFRPVVDYFMPAYLLGMTATPDRTDDVDIRDIFGEEVVDISLEMAIINRWLTPFEYHVITDNLHPTTLKRLIREEFGEERRVTLLQLNESIFIRLRDDKVAERIMRHNKKTIIFCERIEHAEYFSEFIPGSKPYHTGRGSRENQATLAAFRSGDLQYILAVDKLNEGVDIPDAEVIVFYRNTDSERIFLQQLGRGARKKPGKEKYIVLDFVSNIHRLLALQEMVERIEEARKEREEFDSALMQLSGHGFDFRFTEEQLALFEVVERMKPKYVSDYPKLVEEYSDKNECTADQVRAGSHEKIWWKCSTCGHEWKSVVRHRVNGVGCPACSNYAVTSTNNLVAMYPELAKEYSDKNKLHADQIYARTQAKLWWKCHVCGHAWKATGAYRAQGGGCPACINKVVTKINNLAVVYPDLAKDYSDKNKLPANKVYARTDTKLWWKCHICEYKWQASGYQRAKGGVCPSCTNRAVSSTNNLATTHPELAKEYSGKNKLPASQVKARTHERYWWECQTCGYEWRTDGYSRTNGNGCPSCSNKIATHLNNLSVTHPEIAREYSQKNKLPADKVVIGARRKFWWKCSRCTHEWQTTGTSRSKGSGCPVCNSLAITHPDLAKEYSPRNKLPAAQISAGSSKRFWWKCSTCDHEWQTSASNRAHNKSKGKGYKGTMCPKCARKEAARKTRKFTKPQLLDQLRQLAKELSKLPSRDDIDAACKQGNCASSGTFSKYFGSVPLARKLAGLE